MRRIRAHLRREWLEQRLLLLAALSGIALLLGVGAYASRARAPQFASVADAILGGGAALVTLALAGELFAGDGRRDGYAFLRRVPGALGPAWAAKTAFYGLAVGTAVVFTAVLGLVVTSLAGGSGPATEFAAALTRADAYRHVLLVLVAGAWVLFASTFVPRAAGATGAALLLVTLLVGPAVLLVRGNPGFRFSDGEVSLGLAGLAAAALSASAFGFLRGHRFARSSWSAAWRGLLVVAVCTAPGLAYARSRVAQWADLRPGGHRTTLGGIVIGAGGRYAYLTVSQDDTPSWVGDRAFRIDLTTGEAVPLGPRGTAVDLPGHGVPSWPTRPAARLVQVVEWDAGRQAYAAVETIDAATGARAPTDPRVFLERMRADLRERSIVRDARGNRAWVREGWFEVDDGSGGVRSERSPVSSPLIARSDGWEELWRHFPRKEYSRFRPSSEAGLLVERAPVVERGWSEAAVPSLDVRLVKPVKQPGEESPAWALLLGAEGTLAPAEGLLPADDVLCPLDPARVLVARDTKSALLAVDPRTGVTRTMARPLGMPEDARWGTLEGRGPDGTIVLETWSDREGRGFVLVDPTSADVRSYTPLGHRAVETSVVAFLHDGRAILVEDRRRLVRVRWGSEEREVLYPRER